MFVSFYFDEAISIKHVEAGGFTGANTGKVEFNGELYEGEEDQRAAWGEMRPETDLPG